MGNQPWPQFQNGIRERPIENNELQILKYETNEIKRAINDESKHIDKHNVYNISNND